MKISNSEYVDLHLHSNYSDGALSPDELVALAASKGLQAMAIADHDSVSGVAAGIRAAERHGIMLITAVELSTQFMEWRDVHLLGYGIDCKDRVFLGKLEEFRERRGQRSAEILASINRQLTSEGCAPIPLADVLSHARDAVGRPHIGRELMKRGYVSSMEEAFRRYLIPCNIPKLYWPIASAIQEIRRIGGLAFLAHPTSITTDHQQLRNIIIELQKAGLDGIEVYNNMAQPEEMEFLRRLALEHGALISGGSDFHGIEEGLEIGRGRGGIRFSAGLLAPLLDKLASRRG